MKSKHGSSVPKPSAKKNIVQGGTTHQLPTNVGKPAKAGPRK